MEFIDRIKEGLDGKYSGLSNGLNRINRYIFGVQRSCYTLLGGLSGSAKTTLMDFMLISALEDANNKGIPVNVFYYSYEIDEVSKKANWLSVLIFKKHGIVISPETIKGLGEFRLTTSELALIEQELPYLNNMFDKINWRWEAQNPTGMYKEWWDHMSKKGKFVEEPYIDENNVKKNRIVKFIPHNPDEYNIVAIDHIALCKLERGFTLKENLDKLSEYAIRVRNLFGMTMFFLQQFNQSLNSVERQKFKGVDISPQQSDYKDSTTPYIDADVVIGLMNAYKMDMDKCLGYAINLPGSTYNLKENFRMLKVVKNRLSKDNVAIGLYFMPEAGSFNELPPVDQMSSHVLDDLRKNSMSKLVQ